jgi:hypothetical protein
MATRKRRWPNIKFVSLPCWWFWGKSPEFLELSAPARMVYFCIKSAYIPGKNGDPGNNGQITFSYSALKIGSGYSSDSTIARAISELEQKGWISRPVRGGLYGGLNKYKLIGKHDPCL